MNRSRLWGHWRAFVLVVVSVSLVASITVYLVHSRTRINNLTVAASGHTSQTYLLGHLFANTIAEHNPRIQLRMVETTGSIESMRLMQERKVDFAILQNDVPIGSSARSVMLLFPQLYHLLVAERSGIRAVQDIKGKRVATSQPGAGSYSSFLRLLQYYGLTESDVTLLAVSSDEQLRLFQSGEVDAVFRNTEIGQELMHDLLRGGARLIPFDQAESMRLSQPHLEAFTIPKGAYRPSPPIPDADLQTVGIQTVFLTHEATDPEIVREVTRILFEQRSALAHIDPLALFMGNPTEGKGLGATVHPGAQAYYDREKPEWLVTYAEPMGFILTVTLLVGSWIWSARAYVAQRKLARGDRYNLEMLKLTRQAYDCDDPAALETMRRRLLEIYEELVQDVESNRVTDDAFRTFSSFWETTMATVRDRMNILDRRRLAAYPQRRRRGQPEHLESA